MAQLPGLFLVHHQPVGQIIHVLGQDPGGVVLHLSQCTAVVIAVNHLRPVLVHLLAQLAVLVVSIFYTITVGISQIFLDAELFNAGQRPAVNVGLSVSRVGGAAQTPSMKKVSSSLRTRLAQYRELAEFMQFGSDIDEETKKTLASGRLLTEALRQPRYAPIEDNMQTVLIFAVGNGFADGTNPEDMERFERELYKFFREEKADLALKITNAKKFDDELKNELTQALSEFNARS